MNSPTWTAADVLTAAAAWVWVPPDAVDLTTADYRLTIHPDRALVHWSHATRPFAEVYGEVTARARDAGVGVLRWRVDDTTRPAGTEGELRARGFVTYETLETLARPLTGPDGPLAPDLDVPADVHVTAARDEAAIRLVGDLGATAFGSDPPTEAQIAGSVADLVPDPRTGRLRSISYLAHLDGVPAGSGGVTFDGAGARRVARLWNGCVLPTARGRGLYRALLVTRLRDAAAAGATLALVKGRTDTSAPILRRAGFGAYGRQRTLQLDLS